MSDHGCGHCDTVHPDPDRRQLLFSAAVVLVAGSGVFAAPAAAESVQKRWASCGNCLTIFYDSYPGKGRCPFSGKSFGHRYGSGARVQLPYDTPEGPRMQGAWRFCNKCNALFFDGYADKGVCGGGGGHQAQGLIFVLRHDIIGGGDRFRYCAKCHVMFENRPGSVCAAGGGHEAAGFKFDLLPENSQRID